MTSPAWTMLNRILSRVFVRATAPRVDSEEPLATTEHDGAILDKFRRGSLLECRLQLPDGVRRFWQFGDNTSTVLEMSGADPANALLFDHLRLADPSPLDLIQVHETEEPAGWLYMTFGFSDLYGVCRSTGRDSGLGFELTLRIPRRSSEAVPPAWPIALLTRAAQLLVANRTELTNGDVLELGEPLDTAGRFVALAFDFDEAFEPVETLSGTVYILSTLALDSGELALARAMGTATPLVHALESVDESRHLDLERPSLLPDQARPVAQAINLSANVWVERQGKRARRMLMGALPLLRQVGGPALAQSLIHLTRLAETQKDPEEALRWVSERLAVTEAALGADALPVADALRDHAWYSSQAGRHEQAETSWDRARTILLAHPPADPDDLIEVALNLGRVRNRLGRFAQAEVDLRSAIELLATSAPGSDAHRGAIEDCARCLEMQGKVEAATALRQGS